MKKIDAQKKSKTSPPTNAKSFKAPKRSASSALDAATEVLRKTGKPMRCQELIVTMSEHGLWKSPAGKTPHATLSAAIMKEIKLKGQTARFKKVDRGQFAFNGK